MIFIELSDNVRKLLISEVKPSFMLNTILLLSQELLKRSFSLVPIGIFAWQDLILLDIVGFTEISLSLLYLIIKMLEITTIIKLMSIH